MSGVILRPEQKIYLYRTKWHYQVIGYPGMMRDIAFSNKI